MQETRRFERAVAELQKLASYGAPYGMRLTAEQEYSAAYQEMVHAGIKPQIRLKYR